MNKMHAHIPRSEEMYKNIVQNVLDEVCKEKLNKYYFLIKQNKLQSRDFSLSKITFRDEPILNLNDDLKENENFDLVFNNSEIFQKKSKKKRKENYLLEKLKSSNDIITDEKIVGKLNMLLKCENTNREIILKKCNLQSLHNSYSFYDNIFSQNYYIMGDEYDFQISKQLNGLSVLSLSSCNNLFFTILNELKKNNCKNLKQLINENVKVEFDQRLIQADLSGKRKRNSIYVNTNMTILKVFYKNNIYAIKNKIDGHQHDINENVIENPHLLFMNKQDAWLLILKCKEETISQRCISVTEYEKERKHIIHQYNSVLDSFEN
ncbi:hypothetical protein, conserved [Plasmodium gonderi]|uniref:Uncharacterized protein n=1 Tax=Plasmodium gonderi TaxID=77519 RepID=A0A1Y1JLD0_PLAGO|nr:hypothetical protein, conserved [Plasmodium gonderi]GAW83241.1 hypothetical protein, conserved [Plasmodium gonderi]